MVDESTNISVSSYLVVFTSFVENDLHISAFLELLYITIGQKDAKIIFYTIMCSSKEWQLNITKFIGFGSDGTSTMVGSKCGVSICLKNSNHFLTPIHCVAHRTSLTTLKATKSSSCNDFSNRIDKILNKVVAFFKRSVRHRHSLLKLQLDLFYAKKSFKIYHKIRWLSRWQAITSLCDSLKNVLTYFRDVPQKSNDIEATYLYKHLRSFKMIYCLNFLTDILHMLSLLSKVFQYKVNVISIASIVKTEISQIRMLFVEEKTELNACTFNEDSGYHVLPDFGPEGGYLKKLAS
jgi:hypothetical protein